MAEKLKIIPLGGLNEIGKNMTVLEYGKDMIVVDCGLGFPEDDMYGVDLVIPDVTYLAKNQNKHPRHSSSPTATRTTSARCRMCCRQINAARARHAA